MRKEDETMVIKVVLKEIFSRIENLNKICCEYENLKDVPEDVFLKIDSYILEIGYFLNLYSYTSEDNEFLSTNPLLQTKLDLELYLASNEIKRFYKYSNSKLEPMPIYKFISLDLHAIYKKIKKLNIDLDEVSKIDLKKLLTL